MPRRNGMRHILLTLPYWSHPRLLTLGFIYSGTKLLVLQACGTSCAPFIKCLEADVDCTTADARKCASVCSSDQCDDCLGEDGVFQTADDRKGASCFEKYHGLTDRTTS